MRGVNMAPGASKTQPPKARKRVDVDPSLLKRSDDGAAFAHCEKCNQDIAVATFDMHDCLNATTKAITTNVKVSAQEAETKNNDKEVGGKRKGNAKGIAGKPAKLPKVKAKKPSKKAAKDPNVPKRPASGFFIFMETFRKTHKEENPDVKGVAAVGKAGGLKWKQMSEKEKAPFNEEAFQRKATYEMALATYKKGSSKTEEVEEEEASAGSEDVEDAGEVDVDDGDEE
jgi:high mobility group protein B3